MSPPGGTSKLGRLADLLGLRRSMVALLTMVVLVGLGERLAERFLPVYLLALGASIQLPGVLNAMDNLLSALYSFPGGYLSDRLGYKRALLVFNLVSLFGFILTLGVVVDDAIVVGESVYKKREEGLPPMRAAIEVRHATGRPMPLIDGDGFLVGVIGENELLTGMMRRAAAAES